jgi:hypothetical protein
LWCHNVAGAIRDGDYVTMVRYGDGRLCTHPGQLPEHVGRSATWCSPGPGSGKPGSGSVTLGYTGNLCLYPGNDGWGAPTWCSNTEDRKWAAASANIFPPEARRGTVVSAAPYGYRGYGFAAGIDRRGQVPLEQGSAQKWSLMADGTLRPTDNLRYCVSIGSPQDDYGGILDIHGCEIAGAGLTGWWYDAALRTFRNRHHPQGCLSAITSRWTALAYFQRQHCLGEYVAWEFR